MTDTAEPRPTLAHVPGLDGLRGIAVAGVVAHHLDRLTGGFLGVDLFFVLSGFLITSLLLVEHDASGRISLRAFWTRRARRLLPAMFTVVAVVGLYAATLARADELARLRREGVGALFYVSNWVQLAAGADYFDRFARPSLLQHFWSLAIEEQFYLVWPVAVLLILKRTRQPARLVGVICATGAMASFGLAMVFYDPELSTLRLYYGTDTRVGAILAGGTAACMVDRWRARRAEDAPAAVGPVVWASAALCVAVIAAAWLWMSGVSSLLWRGGLASTSIAAAVLVGVVGTGAEGLLTRALTLRPLVWLGRVSYGLYLWHWPIIVVVDPVRTGLDGLPLDVLRVSISLALAGLSLRLVERPIRAGGLGGAVLLRRAGAAMAVTALITVWGTRPAPEVPTRALLGAEDLGVRAAGASTGSGADGVTTTTAVGRDAEPLRLVVVGDSVGRNFGQAAERLGGRFGFVARDSAVIGCPLVSEPVRNRWTDGRTVTTEDECSDWRLRWQLNIGDTDANTVLVAYGAAGQSETEVSPGVWAKACEPAFDEFFRRNFEEALDMLGRLDVRVGVTNVPYYRGERRSEVLDRETDCVNRQLRAAVRARPDVVFLDLADWVCPSGACRTEIGGVELRPDGLHYTDATAEVVLNWLLTDLLGPWSDRVGSSSSTTTTSTTATSSSTTTSTTTIAPAG